MSDKPAATSTAEIQWDQAGVPESGAFGDVYFSRDNGLEETRYVFLGQNHLTERWLNWQGALFTVAETGFGTGLNFLATWQAFRDFRRQHPQHPLRRLQFVTTEKYPLTRADLSKALALWPELSALSQSLCRQYPLPERGCHRLQFALDPGAADAGPGGEVLLDLWLMDVQEAMSAIPDHPQGWIDAWFLDGFAPSKNPDMWQQALFDAMARHARPGCTVATFTAAGFVRRGLISAGFAMKKVPGFGSKREMIAGVLEKTAQEMAACRGSSAPWFCRVQQPVSQTQRVTIVGGGLAGVSTAWALARRGINSRICFKEAELAQGASGNRQGALYPFLNIEHSPHSQLYQSGFLYAERLVSELIEQGFEIRSGQCGVLQLALDEKRQQRFSRLGDGRFSPQFVQWLTAEQASDKAGFTLPFPGLWFPRGRWVNPGDLCRALLAHGRQFADISLAPETVIDNPVALAEQGPVVLATGWQASELPELEGLGLDAIRGQVSHIPADSASVQLKTVLCYDGYLTPADSETHPDLVESGHRAGHCLGASFVHQWPDLSLSSAESEHNLDLLRQALPDWPAFSSQNGSKLDGRVGVRGISRDHVPLVGAVPERDGHNQAYLNLAKGNKASDYPAMPMIPNLYINAGHGARGICSAPLCGELLAAEICQQLPPLSQPVLNPLSPNRRWLRELKRGHSV